MNFVLYGLATATALLAAVGYAAPKENDGNMLPPSMPGIQQSEHTDSADGEATTDGIPIVLTVGDETFTATLLESESSRAFVQLFPLSVSMSELNGNEMYAYTNDSLPVNASASGQIHAGDIMLYGDNCLVLFYQSFSTSYSYTRLGRIENADDFSQKVGQGDVTVTFSRSPP